MCDRLNTWFLKDVIEREVIDDAIDGLDDDTSNLKIEIRRLQVQMECAYQESEPAKHVQEMSRQTKIDTIIELMKKQFKVPADKQVQIYYRPPNDNPSFTKNMMTQVNMDNKSTLLNTSYAPDDTIVMRVMGPDEVSTCCSRPHVVPPGKPPLNYHSAKINLVYTSPSKPLPCRPAPTCPNHRLDIQPT